MSVIKDIFWEMPVEMWTDGFMGKFMSFLWFSILILLFVLVFALCFFVADKAFLTYREGSAVVIQHRFDPAHSETTMQTMIVGKTTMMIPHTTNYPDRYYLKLKINNLTAEMQVEKNQFDEIKDNNEVKVKYSKNRLSDGLTFE